MNPYNIVLVFPEQKFEQTNTIRLELSEKLQAGASKPRLDRLWSEAEALQRCEESPQQYDLMITSLDIPKDSESPRDPEAQRGISLIKSLRRNRIGIPCVLLTDYRDEKVDAVIGKYGPAKAVVTGVGNWESDLIVQCLALLLEKAEEDKQPDKPSEEVTKDTRATREENRGIVEIRLWTDRDRARCGEYRIDGKLKINVQPLSVDRRKLNDLRNRSDNITFIPNWEKELHGIGYELWDQFSRGGSNFEADMTEAINRCGGKENIRICFVLDKEFNPVVVEALLDRRDNYYMLCCPIFRTLPVDVYESTPLFTDSETRDRPTNCLIIEADTSGTVWLENADDGDKELRLERLANVAIEGSGIRNYLSKKKRDSEIGEIKRLSKPSKRQPYFDKIKDVLNQGTWHLVHFAGHSYYDRTTDKGYIFVPGRTKPVAVPAEEFARRLRQAGTRFLYLSSCESGGANFVYELAKKQVPSVLGFRWDIDDQDAAEHALLFYENLFDGEKSLEYAFLKTRQQMYTSHKDHRIWCAAVLVIGTRP